MKKCIWCSKTENTAPFKKEAHTVPQSLGGRQICQNVCDLCNSFFGSHQIGKPSIETILKESLNVSKFRILNNGKPIGRGHPAGRFKSIYFDVNFKRVPATIRLKAAYSLRPNFQKIITRQFKRGLYKVFLEETERKLGNAHEDRFNFIRAFARYDLGDCPVLHFERSVGILYLSMDLINHPKLSINSADHFTDWLITEYGFLEFEILGHVFAIATSPLWMTTFDLYIQKSIGLKKQLFTGYRLVKEFDDVDLTLNRCFDESRDKKAFG